MSNYTVPCEAYERALLILGVVATIMGFAAGYVTRMQDERRSRAKEDQSRG